MLDLRDITSRQGAFCLGPLSLRLSSGITGIIGPNGSGKSTLCRIAATLTTPTSGTVLLQGKGAGQLSQAERAGLVAYVPQELPTASGHSLLDFVSMGYYRFSREYYRDGRADAEAALGMVDLTEHAQQDFMSLSGGEKRRAALARALLQDAAILILDEPGSFLDYHHNRRMAGILRRIGKEHSKTVAVVSHNIDFLGAVCGRVVGMKEGRIVCTGDAQSLLRDSAILSDIFSTKFIKAGKRVLPDYQE